MKLKTNKGIYSVALASVLLFGQGCGNSKNSDASSDTVAADSMDAQESDEDKIREKVEQWNSSLNNRDQRKSAEVYAPEVFFYTQQMSGDKASEMRIDAASKDPSWHQSIVTDIEVTSLGDGRMEASFTKQSDSAKGIRTYPAYLYFEKIGREWKIVRESDKVTDKNVSERKAKVPSDAVRGDFDGDGKVDHVWYDAKYDSDDYVVNDLKLKSDNDALMGLPLGGTRGALLINVGDLNGSNRDFLGIIDLYDSNWTSYGLYGWKDGKWKKVIPSFTVWMGDDDTNRVWKSDRKGYVVTKVHDMGGDVDTMFDPKYITVKLNW